MSLFSLGFSPGTLTPEDIQSIEDREWEENFEEKFEDDPEAGFERDPQRAWETIAQDPEILTKNPNMAQLAADNNPGAFVNIVDENQNLLSDSNVRAAYESLISSEPRYAQAYPETLNTFLLEEGVEESSFGLENGEIELVSYRIIGGSRFIEFRQREGDNIIVASLESLQGSRITPNGEVVYPNGVSVVHGEIGRIPNSDEISVSQITDSSRPNKPAQVLIEGRRFESEILITGDDSIFGSYVRTLDSNGPPISIGSEGRYLADGIFGINNNEEIFQGTYERRSFGPFDIDGLPSLDRSFQSNVPTLLHPNSCREGVSSCIVDQETSVFIRSHTGNINARFLNHEDVGVTVDHILGGGEVVVTSILDGEVPTQFRVRREGTDLAGVINDKINLRTSHLFGRTDDQRLVDHIFTSELNGVRIGIDFPDEGGIELPALLTNVDWDEAKIEPGLAVNTMSNLGLPTDLETRWELYNQLVELGVAQGGFSRGSGGMNEELVKGLQLIQSGDISTQMGYQAPSIFELDPNAQGFTPQSGEVELPSILQDANFQGVNFNDPSIVRIMNQMGLDSSFAARQQLYRELFGREPPTTNSGADMNIALRNALREIHIGGIINTGDSSSIETLSQQQIAQGQRMTPRGQNFDGGVVIRNLPSGLRQYHPNGMTVDEAAARTLFGECRGCTDTEMRLLADVIRNRAYLHNGDFSRVIFAQWQFSPWNGFTTSAPVDSNGVRTATTNMNDQQMQRAMRIWRESANGDTSNGATHFHTHSSSPRWAPLLVSTVPQGVNTQHRIGYLSRDDPFRPAVVRARNE